jgi:hypothetical protein
MTRFNRTMLILTFALVSASSLLFIHLGLS